MKIYAGFATLYANGAYPSYSATIADILPSVLKRFPGSRKDILDLACGEGTFAIKMAKKGFKVTGIDQSPSMLRLARLNARKARLNLKFVRGDMRSLRFNEKFDLATCWFDSLNYLLKQKDLECTFRNVHRALHERGLFIFDMNTIYALSNLWQKNPSTVEIDTSEFFCVHRPAYDKKRHTATLKITGFVKKNGAWTRVDEKHLERGYSLAQIKRGLEKAGFGQLEIWGSIRKMTKPKGDSRRVWFVAQRSD